MHTTPDTPLESALRERGMRVTQQRLLIHRALRELDRHATADELLAAISTSLPRASLPTVYATLELLEELGYVRRVSAGKGPATFDPRLDEHHHLACRRCGAVEDLDAPLDSAGALLAARRRGFEPEGAALVVSGLCPGCA